MADFLVMGYVSPMIFEALTASCLIWTGEESTFPFWATASTDESGVGFHNVVLPAANFRVSPEINRSKSHRSCHINQRGQTAGSVTLA